MRIAILILINIFCLTSLVLCKENSWSTFGVKALSAEETKAIPRREHFIFVPPKDWDWAIFQPFSPRVKINFYGKASKEFRPSLNLAIEKVNISMNEYIDIIQKNFEADPNNRWRDLGRFSVSSGEARLVEVDSKTPIGNMRILQLITIKNNVAYILTGTALKEESSKYYKDFQDTFHSIQFTSDPIEAIPSQEKRTHLQELYAKLLLEKKRENEQLWHSFQEAISLALKEEFFQLYKQAGDIYSSFNFTPDFIAAATSPEKLVEMQEQYLKDFDEKKKESYQLWLSFQKSAVQSMKEAFLRSFKDQQEIKESDKIIMASDKNPFENSQQLWLSFQEAVINDYKEMGAYWQILTLQVAQEKLEEE